MSTVQTLYDLTSKMNEKMKQFTAEKSREELLTEINAFLDKRDELLEKVRPPFTKVEEQLGKEIVQMNEEIQNGLQTHLLQIKGSMKQVQNKKRNNTKYMNPYKNVSSVDGMFFDKKN